MGWNCPSCGHLLKPIRSDVEELKKLIREYICYNCGEEWNVHKNNISGTDKGTILVCVTEKHTIVKKTTVDKLL